MTSTTLTLTERIEGRPGLRILREFVNNSALFLLFDATRSITTDGFNAYLTSPARYIMFIAACVQAWFLGHRRDLTNTPVWRNAVIVTPVTLQRIITSGQCSNTPKSEV